MLTLKELEYVNVSSDKVPFPGKNYALEAADKLIQAFDLYKKCYQDKDYDIIMSDGKSLNFEILKKNLAHMLGIDYKKINYILLKEHGDEESLKHTSYEVLEELISRLEEIIDHDSKNSIRFINYFRLMIKCSIFTSFSNFSSFDFGIINFDHNRQNTDKYKKFGAKSNHLFFMLSNEAITPYYFMGIRKDSDEGKDFVETLYAPISINDFVDQQELVIPTQILITDNSNMELTKLTASSREKREMLRLYQNIISSSGIQASINIMGDYESMLNEDVIKLTRKNN